MKLYYNDHEDLTSIKVNSESIPELIGIPSWEYYQNYGGDYKQVNRDFEEFSFTEEPMYND